MPVRRLLNSTLVSADEDSEDRARHWQSARRASTNDRLCMVTMDRLIDNLRSVTAHRDASQQAAEVGSLGIKLEAACHFLIYLDPEAPQNLKGSTCYISGPIFTFRTRSALADVRPSASDSDRLTRAGTVSPAFKLLSIHLKC